MMLVPEAHPCGIAQTARTNRACLTTDINMAFQVLHRHTNYKMCTSECTEIPHFGKNSGPRPSAQFELIRTRSVLAPFKHLDLPRPCAAQSTGAYVLYSDSKVSISPVYIFLKIYPLQSYFVKIIKKVQRMNTHCHNFALPKVVVCQSKFLVTSRAQFCAQ